MVSSGREYRVGGRLRPWRSGGPGHHLPVATAPGSRLGPVARHTWVKTPAIRVALYGIYGFGWVLLLGASFAINHFDLFGLRQAWFPCHAPHGARSAHRQRRRHRRGGTAEEPALRYQPAGSNGRPAARLTAGATNSGRNLGAISPKPWRMDGCTEAVNSLSPPVYCPVKKKQEP